MTMRAIVQTKNGVALQEKKIPHACDRNSVLIKVTLAGLCRTDLYVAQHKIPVDEGRTLGHEFTGIVEKIGPGVEGIQQGQRVCVMPVFLNDNGYSMLGIEIDGAYADYVMVPATNVYPIPDHLSLEEAAFMEPVAASLAVCNAPSEPHQRGLIYGSNRIAELTRRILNIKGFYSIDLCVDNQMPNTVNEYDFIIETSPTAAAFENIVRLVKRNGLILLKSRPFLAIPLPVTMIAKKELRLIGVNYGDFKESIELLATQRLDVNDLFGQTYSFDDAIPILLGEKIVAEDKKIFFKP